MDKIEKALSLLSSKEKDVIKKILTQLMAGSFKDLDTKKLRGYEDIFRVRKGKLRIIFIKNKVEIKILKIERRSDTTYNF